MGTAHEPYLWGRVQGTGSLCKASSRNSSFRRSTPSQPILYLMLDWTGGALLMLSRKAQWVRSPPGTPFLTPSGSGTGFLFLTRNLSVRITPGSPQYPGTMYKHPRKTQAEVEQELDRIRDSLIALTSGTDRPRTTLVSRGHGVYSIESHIPVPAPKSPESDT